MLAWLLRRFTLASYYVDATYAAAYVTPLATGATLADIAIRAPLLPGDEELLSRQFTPQYEC